MNAFTPSRARAWGGGGEGPAWIPGERRSPAATADAFRAEMARLRAEVLEAGVPLLDLDAINRSVAELRRRPEAG
ncbi:MAG: hypothetical protein K2X11_07120 [Acetobacteraceae bacterium]|nr:hypothetical protein [Acetobacteraceae bacterium]